jgi:hypothetical protein
MVRDSRSSEFTLGQKVPLKECAAGHVSRYSGRWRQSIIGASEWQFSDGLYAEVLFWRASGPIARRWIVLTYFGELLIVFNCSVLSFWTEVNIHREQNRYVTIYTWFMSVQASHNRLCLNLSINCNGSLVTWTVVCLNAAKVKALCISCVGLRLVLHCEALDYDNSEWLLLAVCIILLWNCKDTEFWRHVQTPYRCVPWELGSGAENRKRLIQVRRLLW